MDILTVRRLVSLGTHCLKYPDDIPFFEQVVKSLGEKGRLNLKMNDEEIRIGKYEGKIPAIKALRTRTGCGLIEAKECVEDEFAKNGHRFGPPV